MSPARVGGRALNARTGQRLPIEARSESRRLATLGDADAVAVPLLEVGSGVCGEVRHNELIELRCGLTQTRTPSVT